MRPFARSERVSGQIQKVLSDILHKKINDPRIKMATITKVKMSADLRLARIYFAVSGKSRKDATRGFDSASGYLKRLLAGRLGLRYMPDLEFYYDDSFDYVDRIEKVLDLVKKDNETYHTTIAKE